MISYIRNIKIPLKVIILVINLKAKLQNTPNINLTLSNRYFILYRESIINNYIYLIYYMIIAYNCHFIDRDSKIILSISKS